MTNQPIHISYAWNVPLKTTDFNDFAELDRKCALKSIYLQLSVHQVVSLRNTCIA